MSDIRKHSSTSNLIRVVLKHATTAVGLTGLSSASTGLIISTITDNEATATAYTVAGSTVESITTLGTFAAPTATKCRFREIDATNHPGAYEIQIADARFSVASAKRLIVSISGATNLLGADYEIQLTQFDAYDAVRGGFTALPNVVVEGAGGLYTRGTGAGQINQPANGQIDANVAAMVNNVIAAAVVAAGALNGKGDWNIGKTGYDLNADQASVTIGTVNALATAAIKSIWDQLASALTTVGSIGKLLVNNIDATISSRATQVTADAIETDTVDIQSRLPAALVGGRMDVSVGAMAAGVMTHTAFALDAIQADILHSTVGDELADAHLDRANGIEAGWTVRMSGRLINSALFGKASGLATTSAKYRDLADTLDRITATVDADGNRTVVIRNAA